MKVMKFGGTSVGSAERMQNVVNLINDGDTKIVVLSAMSGTTNSLIEFTNYLRNGNGVGYIRLTALAELPFVKHCRIFVSLYDFLFIVILTRGIDVEQKLFYRCGLCNIRFTHKTTLSYTEYVYISLSHLKSSLFSSGFFSFCGINLNESSAGLL